MTPDREDAMTDGMTTMKFESRFRLNDGVHYTSERAAPGTLIYDGEEFVVSELGDLDVGIHITGTVRRWFRDRTEWLGLWQRSWRDGVSTGPWRFTRS